MYIEEFLVKLGFDTKSINKFTGVINTISNGANEINDSVKNISASMSSVSDSASDSLEKISEKSEGASKKISKAKVGILAIVNGIMKYGCQMASAFNSAIDNAEKLYQQKDVLFKISKAEINQVAQYKKAMSLAGTAIDSIKTKIALGLVPGLTQVANGFLDWLNTNKDLIANGITKVVQFLSKAIQVIANFVRFIDKIISSTIGWENALVALGIAWAVFNRALLFSPIGIIIGLITTLMLLIDDLMTYMNGGDSLFGEYWQPLINGAKAAWKAVKMVWSFIKAIWQGDSDKIKSIFKSLFDSLISSIKSVLSSIFKNILMFFCMIESGANKAVECVGKIFNFIIDLITLPFRLAYDAIISIMDMLGIDAGDVVNGIMVVFSTLFDVLTAPFQFAWDVISDLFDIWEDDTTSLVDKIISSFASVGNKIIAPFKFAIDWIKGKFSSVIDGVTSKLEGVLSFFGINLGSDKVPEQKFNNAQASSLPQAGTLANNTKTINQGDITNNFTISSSDANVSAREAGNIIKEQIVDVHHNTQSAMGA